MKLYLTKDSKRTLKKNYKFTNKDFFFIDVEKIALAYKVANYKSDLYANYVLSQEIIRQIKHCYNSKRHKNLIYIVKSISTDSIENVVLFFNDLNVYFTDFILIDYNLSVDAELYGKFTTMI